MKKIVILLSLLLSLNTLSDEWPHENISNAVFALDIKDRVPINIVEEADNSLGKIYFFTNIRNLDGERITHRWIYKDKVMADVSFDINGPRWRVWSSKNLWYTWIGKWKVQVLRMDGSLLYEKIFNYTDKE
ncbi:MAG TPA: DUF2914 domain-containing protein [Candidatus Marinimicrobia bacterium]|jgi:hypothetical protein|uniref:DUF2914 domain-containing protein n=1 Tax=marine metagenome TaxID=408172 RepID=A0A381N617_9ZZZZ|nr:DUF2914 domain-containing protein [Candidatus Neomarinimicrobiota bacterium]|tara:strand:+ start:1265 stop:1657 length:393 start_codon:yes stop_codon:yes gene_type:complete